MRSNFKINLCASLAYLLEKSQVETVATLFLSVGNFALGIKMHFSAAVSMSILVDEWSEARVRNKIDNLRFNP